MSFKEKWREVKRVSMILKNPKHVKEQLIHIFLILIPLLSYQFKYQPNLSIPTGIVK